MGQLVVLSMSEMRKSYGMVYLKAITMPLFVSSMQQ
jgi:hypothetical protein